MNKEQLEDLERLKETLKSVNTELYLNHKRNTEFIYLYIHKAVVEMDKLIKKEGE